MKLRRTLASAAVAAVLAALVGCGGGAGKPASAGDEPRAGGTAVFALEAESPGYVPGIPAAVAYSGAMVWTAIYDGLTEYDNSGQIHPHLAQSIEPNADYTAWTVKLRPNVKYASGGLVTAQDVARVFKEYYAAKDSSVAASYKVVESATATDASTVVFKLAESYADFPAVLSTFYVFNPNVRDKHGDDFGAHPDGTGPYKLVSWKRNSEIELERNENYWRKDDQGRQLPYLDKITLRIIPSGSTRNATLESHGIDGYQSVQSAVLHQATKIRDAKVMVSPAGADGWFMNTQKPPTDDVRIRQALAHATDRAAVLAAQGADEILTSVDQYYPKSSPYFSQAASDAAPSFDPGKAKELVSEYVNDPRRSDGKAVGEPVSLQVNYIAGDETSTSAVQIAQQQWSAAGFKVSPNALDEAGWVGAAFKGDTQAFWFAWTTNSPAYVYRRTYSDPAKIATNWTRLDDDVVQKQIATLTGCADMTCRKAATGAIAKRFAEVVPVIPLMSVPNGFAYDSSRIGGAKFLPGGEAGFVGQVDWALLWSKG